MSPTATQHPAPRTRGRVFSRPGVSLLELVMVMAIAGVMAAVAIPRVSGSMWRQRALAAAKRLASDLAYARADAIAASAGRRVYFSLARGMYVLKDSASPVTQTPAPYVVVLGDAPYQCTLVGASFGDDAAVTYKFASVPESAPAVVFDGFGVPDSDGWVVVQSGDAIYVVAMDAAGQVSLGPISANDLAKLIANGTLPVGLSAGGQ